MVEGNYVVVLKEAIANPEFYSHGANRKKLQASFGFLLTHLCRNLCKKEFVNRQMFRRELNRMELRGLSNEEITVVSRLKEVLKECDPLFSKTYADHLPDLAVFLQNHLSHLLEVM